MAFVIADLISTKQDSSLLNSHVLSAHEGIKLFKCNICNEKFSEKSLLNSHVSSVHEGVKPFKCGVFGARFA